MNEPRSPPSSIPPHLPFPSGPVFIAEKACETCDDDSFFGGSIITCKLLLYIFPSNPRLFFPESCVSQRGPMVMVMIMLIIDDDDDVDDRCSWV